MRKECPVRTSPIAFIVVLVVLCAVPRASAQAEPDPVGLPAPAAASASQATATPRPLAVEYSEGYALRRKIHVYASLATAPLFVTQYFLGDKLYDGDASGSVKSAHSAVAAGIGALFAVNTVTGAWNLWEARKDPNGRKRRVIHGLSMMAADAGFLASAMTAPDDDEGDSSRALHRNVSLASVGVASASYVYMLLTR
jgi:hypothetical protein